MRLRRAPINFFLFDAAVLFAVASVFLFRVWRPVHLHFEYNSDEGLNLMKALLYARGHALYSEIWSDQPPLFTALLSSWMRLFGFSAAAGRLFVVVMAIVLLWYLYRTVRLETCFAGGLFALSVMPFTDEFLRSSVSVRVTIPCLALAMVSLYAACRYSHEGRRGDLIISALFFGLSLLVKFLSLFVASAVAVLIARRALRPGASRDRLLEALHDLFCWGALAASSAIGLAIALAPALCGAERAQLFTSHVAAASSSEFDKFLGSEVLIDWLLGDWELLLLAVVSLFVCGLRFRFASAAALSWFGVALVVLFFHQPVWKHHYLFLSLPIVWLGSLGAGSIWRLRDESEDLKSPASRRGRAGRLTVFVLSLSCLALAGEKASDREGQIRSGDKPCLREISKRLSREKERTHWVFADDPMIPFAQGFAVPPPLAAVPAKRLMSGLMDREEMISVLMHYRPEQIVIVRYRQLREDLDFFLEANYVPVCEDGKAIHLIRRDLKTQIVEPIGCCD